MRNQRWYRFPKIQCNEKCTLETLDNDLVNWENTDFDKESKENENDASSYKDDMSGYDNIGNMRAEIMDIKLIFSCNGE